MNWKHILGTALIAVVAIAVAKKLPIVSTYV